MSKNAHISEKIAQLVEETLPEAFVVECVLPDGGQHSLTLLVDTDKGINIDECTKISRVINRWLEETEVYNFPYIVEVSSPGLTRPLKVHRQYTKNIGRSLKVMTQDGKVLSGLLGTVNEEGILLNPAPKKKINPKNVEKAAAPVKAEQFIPFKEIKEAKVKISMNN